MRVFWEWTTKCLLFFQKIISIIVFYLWLHVCVCRYGHMIDNVVLIVTGTLHERDVHELLEKCHPLGMFDRYWLLG